MGSIGAPELIVIFLVALIVLGPDRLPRAARQFGRAVSEFKRVSSGFQDEVRKAIDFEEATAPTSAPGGGPGPSTSPAAPPAGTDADVPPPPDDPPRA